MAIIIKTTDPQGLLDAIKIGIDAVDVLHWDYDKAGDFTYTPDPWQDKAWLRPRADAEELRFGLLGRNEASTTSAEYGIFHARFIEMLLTHFDKKFSTVHATSTKTEPDNFK